MNNSLQKSQVLRVLPPEEWEAQKATLNEILSMLKKKSPLDDFIVKEDFMQKFGLSDASFYRLRASGKIKVLRLGGKQVVKISDLIKALEAGE